MALALGSSLVLVLGCATPRGQQTGPAAGALENAKARVRAAGLSEPRVTVETAASLEEFRARTGQSEPALRAWTAYDHVTLAPLASWSDASPSAVERRLTHELCHAAIEQSFGARDAAERARIPRFFEEGACSNVAGDVRLSLAEVRARLQSPDEVPFTVEGFARDPQLAYAASHHFIAALIAAHGSDLVPRVLALASGDGAAGCIERAIASITTRDVVSEWRAFALGGGAA